MEWRNQQAFWAVLVTLIVGIFLFAQGYIMFSINQLNHRLTQMDARMSRMETRLESLNQNYIDHLAHHMKARD